MVKLSVARFAPDRSPYALDASPDQLNVIPTSDGVEPLPGPQAFTPSLGFLTDELGNPITDEDGGYIVTGPDGDPLVGEVILLGALGSFFGRLPDGTNIRITGTATGLYRFDTTSITFVEISGASAPYSMPVDGRWSFAQFGSVIYAQNGADAEQMYDMSSSTEFEDNPTAPIAKYLMVANDRLHRLRLLEDPSKQQWSGLNDPTFNTIGLKGCDVQVQPIGNGIAGGVDTSFGALVFCRNAIRRQIYSAASQWVYEFYDLTTERGAIAPGSICKIGQDDFCFYSADGFFRGIDMQPIGAERLDKWFLNMTTEENRVKMTAARDRRRKIVWFRFQVTNGASWCLGYLWQLNEWCLTDAPMADFFTVETAGITIDGVDAFFSSIDEVNIPFDSSFWDGGATEFGGITDDGYFALFNGPNMAARIVSNQASDEGHQRAFVNSGRLDSDAVNHTVTLSTADKKGGTFRDRAPVTPSARTGKLPVRGDGRIFKIKTEIPEGEAWTYFGGIWIENQGSGSS